MSIYYMIPVPLPTILRVYAQSVLVVELYLELSVKVKFKNLLVLKIYCGFSLKNTLDTPVYACACCHVGFKNSFYSYVSMNPKFMYISICCLLILSFSQIKLKLDLWVLYFSQWENRCFYSHAVVVLLD